MSNSDNPKNGAAFQREVLDWFEKEFNKSFELEKKLLIGNPSKEHKFDIVDEEDTIAIECKRYTWTRTGNVPSAKMGAANEAAFYLRLLPLSYTKYIVMMRTYCARHQESLAEYYYRTYKHLLGSIIVAEYDPDKDLTLQDVFRKEQVGIVVVHDNDQFIPFRSAVVFPYPS